MSESKSVEILKMALLMEHRGKAFYKKVAEQTNNEVVKKIFNIMADEEQLHIEFLGKQFAFFQKNKKFDINFINAANTDESIISQILTNNIKEKISASGFEAAAISAAIDMENKAIEVYGERAAQATDLHEKELYEWLSNWEKEHHKILNELNKELTEKIWYDNNFWPY